MCRRLRGGGRVGFLTFFLYSTDPHLVPRGGWAFEAHRFRFSFGIKQKTICLEGGETLNFCVLMSSDL